MNGNNYFNSPASFLSRGGNAATGQDYKGYQHNPHRQKAIADVVTGAVENASIAERFVASIRDSLKRTTLGMDHKKVDGYIDTVMSRVNDAATHLSQALDGDDTSLWNTQIMEIEGLKKQIGNEMGSGAIADMQDAFSKVSAFQNANKKNAEDPLYQSILDQEVKKYSETGKMAGLTYADAINYQDMFKDINTVVGYISKSFEENGEQVLNSAQLGQLEKEYNVPRGQIRDIIDTHKKTSLKLTKADNIMNLAMNFISLTPAYNKRISLENKYGLQKFFDENGKMLTPKQSIQRKDKDGNLLFYDKLDKFGNVMVDQSGKRVKGEPVMDEIINDNGWGKMYAISHAMSKTDKSESETIKRSTSTKAKHSLEYMSMDELIHEESVSRQQRNTQWLARVQNEISRRVQGIGHTDLKDLKDIDVLDMIVGDQGQSDKEGSIEFRQIDSYTGSVQNNALMNYLSLLNFNKKDKTSKIKDYILRGSAMITRVGHKVSGKNPNTNGVYLELVLKSETPAPLDGNQTVQSAAESHEKFILKIPNKIYNLIEKGMLYNADNMLGSTASVETRKAIYNTHFKHFNKEVYNYLNDHKDLTTNLNILNNPPQIQDDGEIFSGYDDTNKIYQPSPVSGSYNGKNGNFVFRIGGKAAVIFFKADDQKEYSIVKYDNNKTIFDINTQKGINEFRDTYVAIDIENRFNVARLDVKKQYDQKLIPKEVPKNVNANQKSQ